MIWPHISPFRCLFSLKFPAPGSCNWPRFTSVMLCETCCVEELGAGLGWCWPIWCPPPFHTLHHIPWDKLHTMVDSLHVEEQMLSMKVPSYWTHFKTLANAFLTPLPNAIPENRKPRGTSPILSRRAGQQKLASMRGSAAMGPGKVAVIWHPGCLGRCTKHIQAPSRVPFCIVLDNYQAGVFTSSNMNLTKSS